MKHNEAVLCVVTELLKQKIGLQKNSYIYSQQELIDIFSACEPQFVLRSEAEHNSSYKQLIPYCLIQDLHGNFLAYERSGTEKRLHGLYSLGVGGHINPEDAHGNREFSLAETLKQALMRELGEEIGYTPPEGAYTCKGLIYEDKSSVGTVHIGIVYVLTLDPLHMTVGEELGQIRWLSEADIALAMQNKSMEFEHWSELAFGLCKGV
ncbi:NUDIX domain-containing protein [Gracilinema caldarium]|uniref:NUDIX domain-containing protein n=1 Tax=Gracilinema caldarium TaxID=215591 RepID=UPI0026EC760B|nr:NUDIX domain-containing protein [Gracilinema caldarium]